MIARPGWALRGLAAAKVTVVPFGTLAFINIPIQSWDQQIEVIQICYRQVDLWENK